MEELSLLKEEIEKLGNKYEGVRFVAWRGEHKIVGHHKNSEPLNGKHVIQDEIEVACEKIVDLYECEILMYCSSFIKYLFDEELSA